MKTWKMLVVVTLAGCGPVIDLSEEQYATVSQDLVVCAAGPTVQGIDVSIYQGTIDWAQVHSSGKAFAIARIGDGTSQDPTFAGHWAAIKANGMIRGAYQYFRPGIDPLVQADLVVAAVGRLGAGDLPVTIDVEAGGTLPAAATYNALIHTWANRVEAGTGKRPALYVGKYYWANINTADFAGYPLWHPQYTTATCPNISNFWSNWKLWQYRGGPVSGIPGGTCPGISGSVDLDVFNGSLADLQAFAGQQTCTPHCEGSVMVGADCGRGDCAASGFGCVTDTLGLRCVFSACPTAGDRDVCLDDAHLAHCHDGALSPPGDCGAFAGRCSTAHAPTGARCVSLLCAASMTEVPHATEGCWPESPARIARCDDQGAFTFTACAADEQCSLIGGVHCEPKSCPATGTVDVCAGDKVAHCVEGQVVSALDCGSSGSLCSGASGAAKCVSRDCVTDPSVAPVAHTTCLPSGWLASCDVDGLVAQAAPCAAGLSCASSGGQTACLASAQPEVVDAGSAMGTNEPVVDPAPQMEPVRGRGCTASPGALLALLALALVRRNRR